MVQHVRYSIGPAGWPAQGSTVSGRTLCENQHRRHITAVYRRVAENAAGREDGCQRPSGHRERADAGFGTPGGGSGRMCFRWPALDSRNPQISSFFCPLCEEAGRAGEIGCALGSHCGATTNDQFRGFFGTCETVSLQTSEPRVAGSSPAGCIESTRDSAVFLAA